MSNVLKRPIAATAALVCAVCAGGCSDYADFTLPLVPGGDPNLTFAFDPLPAPVIEPGSASDALNPSVIRTPDGLLNYFSVFDRNVWSTAAAASRDGIHWEARRTILTPDPRTWEGSYIAANGAALWWRGEVWYWYQAGPKPRPRIGLLRTRGPVLDYGPYMSWDERAVADPDVIRIEPYFYMYYLGQDRAGPPRQRLGIARSRDGVHWEKLRANPILELGAPGSFDEAGLGEPAVWAYGGFYWMLYTGRDASERRRLGLARSTDGVRWEKRPVIFAGSQRWDAQVLCDATVLVESGEMRVWFGGGDVPSPDEGLHGRIGYGTLRPVR